MEEESTNFQLHCTILSKDNAYFTRDEESSNWDILTGKKINSLVLRCFMMEIKKDWNL